MSDAVIFTEQEQDELDNGDPVQALWRMENEARGQRGRPQAGLEATRSTRPQV